MTHPFSVDGQQVAATRLMIAGLANLVVTLSIKVTAADFPMWCRALGVSSMYATRTKSGASFVHTSRSVTSDRFGNIFFGVTCDERPAPWVEPPMSEGTRTFRFTAVETESH